MSIIPSVDIKDGRCVKLIQGKPGSGMVISDDPVSTARMWERLGAKVIHVVDLDGALEGGRRNWAIVSRMLKEVNVPIEVGGGIRDVGDVGEVIKAGARWAILGTVAVEEQGAVESICRVIDPKKIIIALDSRGGKVVTRGWTANQGISPVSLARRYERLGVAAYLYTAVEVEGTGKRVDLEGARELVSSTKIPVIYSGGVSSVRDLVELSRVGARGVVVGSALYKRNFTLREAEEVVEGAIN